MYRAQTMGGLRAIVANAGGRPSRAWPRALVILLLACWLVQGTAIQTHIHFVNQTRLAQAAAGPSAGRLTKPLNGNDPADCPLCQEAAMAGAYLLPPAIALPSPPVAVLWLATATITEFKLLAPRHGWQSRAPPE